MKSERLKSLEFRVGLREAALLLLILCLTAGAAKATEPSIGEAGSALIFVLGISLIGAFCGLIAALVGAVAASLIYNFYFVEPVLTFTLTSGRDLAPVVVFTLCALVTGALAGRLKDRAEVADRSNRYLSSLLNLSSGLLSVLMLDELVEVVGRVVPAGDSQCLQLFRVKEGGVVPLQPHESSDRSLMIAAKALIEPKGVVRDLPLVAYRLLGSRGPVGVMVLSEAKSDPWPVSFASAVANLVALAMERAALSEAIAEAQAIARAEELKTALLSSVSHDFRTPLTAISAAASSLVEYRDQLDRDTSLKLLQNIVEECDRLNRYTTNLLEMGRLEAGDPATTAQTLGISDVVQSVVQRFRARWPERITIVDCRCGDSLVRADASLFELVLANVLDNSARYSEDGSRILVEIREGRGFGRISILDEGSGIPDADRERVFERFYRVSRAETSPRGTGLGLAIAKGFVEALGGSIEATTPGIGDRGTRVTITLPLAEAQLP